MGSEEVAAAAAWAAAVVRAGGLATTMGARRAKVSTAVSVAACQVGGAAAVAVGSG